MVCSSNFPKYGPGNKLGTMQEISPIPGLSELLVEYRQRGGVLDYVFLQSEKEMPVPELHRAAALAGMAAIDQRLERWAISQASGQYSIEIFYRVTWDEGRLIGQQISSDEFGGSADQAPGWLPSGSNWIPNVDGYKTAFLYPPYPLRGSDQENQQLFANINAFTLGPDPQVCEIFSWGTDWSNYFDAGKEWWGAFFWTLRQSESDVFIVIGASTTD